MGIKKGKTDYLLSLIREGKSMTLGQQLRLTAYLSVPAIMAQVSSIAMQYIDASMVGSLGANAAASIGLVSTTTWLFWGLCAAAATGFSVQVAHRIGAGDFAGAKKILRQSVTATLVFSSLLAVVGISISGVLPGWLGGDEMIRSDSSFYFRIFSLFLPALQLNFLAGGMLRCSGNMRVPSMLNVLMCFWDVVFNFFLIFPTRQVDWWGWEFIVPGVGLGVEGAVLGTVLAELITAGGMMNSHPHQSTCRVGKIRKKLNTTSQKHISTFSILGTRIFPLHRNMPPARKFNCKAGKKSENIRK
jgi:Na+-driven multidrug efflux pump